ncbi:MAG: YicC family protein [Bacteroidales bacterium]|nr:YicC family protein [Bacteroidales bacterium]
MLKSMTGYGKAECLMPTRKLTIEIKSLNSKQIDTSTRLPSIYREKELEIRQLLARALERGKIECTFHYEITEGAGVVINKNVFRYYIDQLKDIAEENNLDSGDLLSAVVRLPDTVVSEKSGPEAGEWKLVKKGILDALEELDQFRIQEGEALEKDIIESIKLIGQKLTLIEPYENDRVTRIRDRIRTNLSDLKLEEKIDENRFEQELLYYLEKLDINEEKVRLKNHLDYFMDILGKGSPNGKKLGFISQEIGREINTLGSKANHSEIQRLIMEMKDELEKIKEQILNVL